MTNKNFIKDWDSYFHFILLAKDAIGHQQIREISTKAWLHSYEAQRMIRVPTYYEDIINVTKDNPGHIIASTACLGGFVGQQILRYCRYFKEDKNEYGKMVNDGLVNWLQKMKNLFGQDNFYLEMQPSTDKEQICVNKEIIKLSELLDIPYIITNDAHYCRKEDASIHEAFLKSQDGDREVTSFYQYTYLMDSDEIETLMGYFDKNIIQQAYKNIEKIKNSCEDYNLSKPLKIPKLIWKQPKSKIVPQKYLDAIPYFTTFLKSDYDGDRHLIYLLKDKLDENISLQNQKIYDAINECLQSTWESSIVNKAHWSAYFLNLQNIIKVCWDAGTLVGPGRGSGVGFILLYLLDIIQINCMWETVPTKPWRFLNPARVSVLD